MAHFGLSPAPVYARAGDRARADRVRHDPDGPAALVGAAALAIFTLAATGMALLSGSCLSGRNASWSPMPLRTSGTGGRPAAGSLAGSEGSRRALRRRRHDLPDRRDASLLQPPGRQQASLSRHGAAISCTPSGRWASAPMPGQTGAAQTGRPRQEIGCVSRPMLARAGRHRPASIRSWAPMGGGHRRGGRDQHVVAREQRQRVAVDAMAPAGPAAPRRRAPGARHQAVARIRLVVVVMRHQAGADAARRPRRR